MWICVKARRYRFCSCLDLRKIRLIFFWPGTHRKVPFFFDKWIGGFRGFKLMEIFPAATAGTSRDWFQSPWRWGLEPIRYKMGLPFRELTYPIKNHFWVDDFPNFSFGGICIRSLEGIIIAPLYFLDEKTWVSLFFFCGILMGGSHDSICN